MNDNRVADILFEYLKASIYHPEKAQLNVEELPPEFQDLGEGLLFLCQCLKEQKVFGKSILKGDFENNVPPVDNVVAAPLKEIHGILKHVIWQTSRVAAGDYNQKLDYFGEFSDSFNTMVNQLKEREEKLEAQRNNLSAKNKELNNLQNLFKELTVDAPYLIIAVDNNKRKDITYLNNEAKRLRKHDKNFFNYIYEHIVDEDKIEYFMTVTDKRIVSKEKHLHVKSNKSITGTNEQIIYVINDETDRINEDKQLEQMAYRDSLTGLPNRRHGMNLVRQLASENKIFSVAFIDIDYLKYCNDEFGHNTGDLYIKLVANKLLELEEPKTICRIGGDEFLVVKEIDDAAKLDRDLTKLRQELIDDDSTEFPKSFSFGIELYDPKDEIDISVSLSDADKKMYSYKLNNKLHIQYKDDRKIK
ncbi:MAG: diguanylate cyclase [Thomasclavelia sp.]|nr:diguanylate cyclase [Thomasclavelia sp.]